MAYLRGFLRRRGLPICLMNRAVKPSKRGSEDKTTISSIQGSRTKGGPTSRRVRYSMLVARLQYHPALSRSRFIGHWLPAAQELGS